MRDGACPAVMGEGEGEARCSVERCVVQVREVGGDEKVEGGWEGDAAASGREWTMDNVKLM